MIWLFPLRKSKTLLICLHLASFYFLSVCLMNNLSDSSPASQTPLKRSVRRLNGLTQMWRNVRVRSWGRQHLGWHQPVTTTRCRLQSLSLMTQGRSNTHFPQQHHARTHLIRALMTRHTSVNTHGYTQVLTSLPVWTHWGLLSSGFLKLGNRSSLRPLAQIMQTI